MKKTNEVERTILIIGGGQLALMMIWEWRKKFEDRFVIVDPNPECPCAGIADVFVRAKWRDREAIVKAAKDNGCTHATIDLEHVSWGALRDLEEMGLAVYPGSEAVRLIQDKLWQKETLRDAGLPVPKFLNEATFSSADDFIRELGENVIFKGRVDGYDGRSVWFASGPDEIAKLMARDAPSCMVEECIDFKKEISVNIAMGTDGDYATWLIPRNKHVNGQLDTSIVENYEDFAVLEFEKEMFERAKKLAVQVAQVLGVVGCCCVEMFVTQDDKLLINEVAPRVHNTFHYTLGVCETSQFENHLRAVTGLPLGATGMPYSFAVMVNILGTNDDELRMTGIDAARALGEGCIQVYDYMKTSRNARKGGHITVTCSNPDSGKVQFEDWSAAEALAKEARSLIKF